LFHFVPLINTYHEGYRRNKTNLGHGDTHRQKDGKLWLSQQKYVVKILMRFNMNNVKPVKVPLVSHFKLSSSLCPSNDEENEYMSHVPYVNVVRSLMYVMVSIRPDISHAIGVVNRYMENLGKEHWEIVKWVLWYIRGTSKCRIAYNGCDDLVCGYVNLDFAGDLEKRRSTSRYVFTLASGLVSWISKLQNIVSLSTNEEKYIDVAHACKEEIWLKGLLGEFGRMQDKVKLFFHSQSVIHLAKNPAYHNNTKHIPIKYHFVRHVIDEGGVALEKVHTQENCVDMFMKLVLLEKL
jgi:hypothetical protein